MQAPMKKIAWMWSGSSKVFNFNDPKINIMRHNRTEHQTLFCLYVSVSITSLVVISCVCTIRDSFFSIYFQVVLLYNYTLSLCWCQSQSYHHNYRSNSLNTAGLPFKITTQPNDICCKPGEQAKLTIWTSPSATTYQWYFRHQVISNPDYKGQTSECLLISKFLPKHKGVYWCVAEDALGTRTTSRHATLTAGNLFALLLTVILLSIIVHGENVILEAFAC